MNYFMTVDGFLAVAYVNLLWSAIAFLFEEHNSREKPIHWAVGTVLGVYYLERVIQGQPYSRKRASASYIAKYLGLACIPFISHVTLMLSIVFTLVVWVSQAKEAWNTLRFQ